MFTSPDVFEIGIKWCLNLNSIFITLCNKHFHLGIIVVVLFCYDAYFQTVK